MTNQLTQSTLKEFISYDPITGSFKWIKKAGRKTAIGTEAGSRTKGGIDIRFRGSLYRSHRLAWLYVVGEWPRWEIDHINGVNTDNRWNNLRDIPHKANTRNSRKARINNISGLLGAVKYPNGYRARINIDGTTVHLGCFKTAQEAHDRYVLAKREFHKDGCTI